MTKSDLEPLFEAGFSEEDIVEITGVVAMFMAANTFVDALGVDPADRDQKLATYLDFGAD